jgi:transcriptional regulator with XRE-family HTH domain
MTNNENLLETIGFKIKTLRQSRSLTQEGMAELLNMSHSNYAKLERGEIDMTIKRLQEIAKIFGESAQNFIPNETNTNYTNCSNNHTCVVGHNQGTIQIPSTELDALRKQMEMFDQALQRMNKKLESMEKQSTKSKN